MPNPKEGTDESKYLVAMDLVTKARILYTTGVTEVVPTADTMVADAMYMAKRIGKEDLRAICIDNISSKVGWWINIGDLR